MQTRHNGLPVHVGISRWTAFIALPLAVAISAGFAMAQSASSNAGLYGGQDGLFDAILATPNWKTPVPQDDIFATARGATQAAPTAHS